MHTTSLVKKILAGACLSFLATAAYSQVPSSPDSAINSLSRNEASALMNSAIEDLKRERGQEAIPKLEQYLQLYPDNAGAHQNLGIAYGMTGNIPGAEREFKIAIEIGGPANVSMSMQNLAGLYESQGDLGKAADTLKRLLEEDRKDIDKATIQSRLKRIQSEYEKAKALREKGQLLNSDYYNEACAAFPTKWPKNSMPLRVFIETNPAVPAEFSNILKASFKEWETASDGIVKFTFVDNLDQADIRCRWTDRKEDFEDEGEAGLNKIYRSISDLHTIERADISLRYKNTQTRDVEGSKKVHLICQHEIGHALGIAGHSYDPGDVMFMATRFSTAEPKLSQRDIMTLKKLYESPNSSASQSSIINFDFLPWVASVVLFLLVVLAPYRQNILKSLRSMFSRRSSKDHLDFTPPKR